MYPRELDPKRCSEIVPTPGLRMGYHQCTKRPIEDGKCGVHCKAAIERRDKKSKERWEENQKNTIWAKLARANEKITELTKENELLKKRIAKLTKSPL